ncbi:F-box protein At2g32560-like [Rutidosis leptorrhynchoides]|uniref:F-box protein At2g32560-like n=1 Tax=Rutidosis leptorrhynchoides TaxID=125765 RepID=UPI003A998837
MLIYFVTFISFILFYKYSISIKKLPSWASEMRLPSFYLWEDLLIFNLKMTSYSKMKTDDREDVKTSAATESRSLLDLPDLALETILEKLEPADLCKMACVSTYLRGMSMSDYHWKHHMKQKWGRIFGPAAKKEWQLYIASQKDLLDSEEKRGFLRGYLSKLWPVMKLKSRSRSYNERKSFVPTDSCSILSCYRALETAKFSFPAQVFNRENGHVGFVMSCYDAELSYNCETDTFEARYPPHGPRAVASENGVTWERLREARVDESPHDLHVSNCLNDLRPKDHIEIQWRRNKQFPYGWWYGVIGHLESCDGNETFCRCHESDIVALEFKQYAPGSQWRHMTINRKDHREEGNQTAGFYGGIKKLYNKDEISMWQQFWPTDILE